MIFYSDKFYYNGIYSQDMGISLVSESSDILNEYGVSYREECTSITEMIDEADALMYEHKEEFRKNNPSKYMVKKIK